MRAVAWRALGVAVVLALAAPLSAPASPAGAQSTAEVSAPEITAEGAVLWEPASDTVIHGVDAEVGRPMASTTKIMTVLLALESGGLEDQVTISERAAEISATPGGASLGLEAGQQVPLGTLLAGLMVHSGNGAAVAVAEHVAGSEDAFAELMNERAGELGLDDSSFVNASGLTDDPEHRASPLDLAKLADVAMSDERFAQMAAMPELSHDGNDYVNRNELLGSYPGATGVKTGFTSLAGLCLVASATREGRTLYAVVLGSEDSFGDVAALLDHGFDDHRLVELGPDDTVAEYRWADASVGVAPTEALALTVPAQERVVRRLALVPTLGRPAESGAEAGAAQLLVAGQVTESGTLRVVDDVPATAEADPSALAGAAVHDALRALARLRPVDHEL